MYKPLVFTPWLECFKPRQRHILRCPGSWVNRLSRARAGRLKLSAAIRRDESEETMPKI